MGHPSNNECKGRETIRALTRHSRVLKSHIQGLAGTWQ